MRERGPARGAAERSHPRRSRKSPRDRAELLSSPCLPPPKFVGRLGSGGAAAGDGGQRPVAARSGCQCLVAGAGLTVVLYSSAGLRADGRGVAASPGPCGRPAAGGWGQRQRCPRSRVHYAEELGRTGAPLAPTLNFGECLVLPARSAGALDTALRRRRQPRGLPRRFGVTGRFAFCPCDFLRPHPGGREHSPLLAPAPLQAPASPVGRSSLAAGPEAPFG